MSQPGQTTPTPAPQVTTVKTTQFEQTSTASGMASKPAAVATATGGASTASSVSTGGGGGGGGAGGGGGGGGGASAVTAARGPTKATAETARVAANRPVAGTTVIDMSSSAGATIVDMSAAAKGSAKAVSKTPPIPQVKATEGAAPSPPTGGTRATASAGMAASAAPVKATPKDPAKSATPDPAKVAKPAVAVAPAASAVGVSGSGKTEAAAKPAQTKVQVEVAPPPAKAAKEAPALDPFDALASILPSVTPLVLPEPVYTGPEVHEHGITAEEGVLCGVREDTLPPNYRYENVLPAPADANPKDVPKPMSTDEALDSLSFGFMSAPAAAAAAAATPAKQEKPMSTDEALDSLSFGFVSAPAAAAAATPAKQEKPMSTDEALDSLSFGFVSAPAAAAAATPAKQEKMESVDAGFSNFAPPPSASVKSPAPPADKKAKIDTVSEGFSRVDVLSSPAPPQKPVEPKPAATTVPKVQAPAPTVPKVQAPAPTVPKVQAPAPPIPKVQAPAPPVPKVQAPAPPVPKVQAPAPPVPKVQAPAPPVPKVQAPAPPVPKVQAPAPTVPKVQAPAPTIHKVQAPAPTVPKVQAPTPTVPKVQAAAPTVPEVQAPAPTVPKVQAAAPTVPKEQAPAPTAPKVQAPAPTVPKAQTTAKPKTDDFDAMSLDALAALGDTLGAPEPVAEIPELRPEDIVSEAKLEEEEGVLVGERDDTLPPEYRYSEEKLKDLPAPKPEPTLAPGEALDFLSGDFMTYPTTAPVVQAPVIPSAPPAQDKVENLSALDALAGDFLTPTQAAVVQAPLPSPAKKTPKSDVCDSAKPNTATEVTPKKPEAKPALKKDDSLSLDALSALSDTLAAPEPAPEPPKLRPEDIVSEAKVEEEEGVLVGERDDTLPPEYRYSEEKLKDLPAPKPEPTLNTGEALDFLSGDFMTPAVRPPAHALPTSTQPPAAPSKHAEAAALDALAGDFIATAVVAPAVKCAASQPAQVSRQMSEGTTSALDALSDTLADIKPVPEPAPVPMKDIAKEKKITEERLIKMGEDDDTLPPEYRPTEEDLKAMAKAEEEAAKAPKEKPMGEAAALDLLSGDFAMAPGPAAPVAAPSAAPCLAPAPVLQPPVLHSEPLKPMAAPALDSLAGTLLPSAMEGKTKGDKPKGKSKSRSKSKKHRAEDPSAVEQLSAELSTDVVSTKKGGKS